MRSSREDSKDQLRAISNLFCVEVAIVVVVTVGSVDSFVEEAAEVEA